LSLHEFTIDKLIKVGTLMMAKRITPMLRVSSLSLVFASLVFALAVTLGGCTISTRHSDGHDNADSSSGKDNNVDIRTPFGSLSVHQGNLDAKDTGLSAYPGAQLQPKNSGHDGDGSANVNISSSLFGINVVALKYVTRDSPDKVLAFYRKDMGKYGKVVDCQGGFNMDFRRREKNDDEVTCEHENKRNGEYKQELKVGTESNQRIVAIKEVDDGTQFALVYVRSRNDKDTM
jgi:hypothetical protein